MNYFWHRLLSHLRTRSGRYQLLAAGTRRLWRVSKSLAMVYRRTLARRPRVVSIVGSLGKTTTLRAVAVALGIPEDRISGLNEWTYVALAMLRVRPWDHHAVIEVGIGAKNQMRLYAELLRPDITVVTSVASEHNRSLQSLNETRTEKAYMVRVLAPSGLAILNGDDPNVLWMQEAAHARVTTFGFDAANDVRASDVSLDWPRGTRFRLHTNGTTRNVRIRLIGRIFIYPILAAVAVGLAEGFPLDKIIPALEHMPPTPERLEPVQLDNGAILLRDDFKSTLETIDAALDVLKEIPARRKIVVLGDVSEAPGSQGPIYRRLGGRVATMADRAIFLGSGCDRYTTGAVREGLPREAITKAGHCLKKALGAIPSDLGEGDVVLIKGRHSQRLGRIALALMGRNVRCKISSCPLHDFIRCDRCKILERG